MDYPVANLALAQRLERAEGIANASFVEARRLIHPDVGAEWINVAGVYAMFDGATSLTTQTFGLGVFDPFSASDLDQLEDFFFCRGTATFHEISSFAAPTVLSLISARGYSPVEASAVLVRPVMPLPDSSSEVAVRVVDNSEITLWSRIAAEGWGSESPELGTFISQVGQVLSRARGVYCFLAELEGRPIAAAALNVGIGIALLAGACTIPDARRRGAQQALLRSRLQFAAQHDLDLAMVVTQPGSASQRNAQRHCFRPMYTRSKWQLSHGGA